MQVLLFQAIALPDGSLLVPPPFIAEGAVSAPGEGPGDLEVELLDAGGSLLSRQRVGLGTPCMPPGPAGAGDAAPARIAQTTLAHHAKARTLRVSQWGRVLHERSVADAPALDIAWPSGSALSGDEVALAWSCADPNVFGLWQFSADTKTWTSLSLPQPAGTSLVDLRRLPGGKACRLRLLVSDGVQTYPYDSKPFALKLRGWTGFVLAPADGAQLSSDTETELVGQGFELEKRVAEFTKLDWSSSIDGALGTGHRCRVRLRPGKHQITLSVLGRAVHSIAVGVD